ncbi:MAG: hypothetical protein HY597_01220 [Candidatus Omnitrophica bacterium]|nr:hypothetical protein [Candidatus Omnitrophota bacterium]
MHILGISCFYHDAAAALLRDGQLVAASDEERFSRKKHDERFPVNAIRFCLEQGGIQGRDLDYVVFYEKPFLKLERILLTDLQTVPRSVRAFRRAMNNWLLDRLWVKSTIQELLEVNPEQILFSEHHLSHAASTFFCSPFTDAAILTADGVGEWTTTLLAVGRANWSGTGRNEIRQLREVRFPHSLGMLYSVFTAFLGFEVNEGEYKVMGMAPYGTPRYVDKVWRLIRQFDDGSFQLDMDYFSYHHSAHQAYGRRFERLFGEPRDPDAPFSTPQHAEEQGVGSAALERCQYYADVAASIQRVCEEVMLNLARALHRETGLSRLCLAGGVALNSVANGRILRETPFQEVYIQPAAGDAGGAVGAALYTYHVLLQRPRAFVMDHAYWGQAFHDDAVQEAIAQAGLTAERLELPALVTTVARSLAQGRVVGWFQGSCEWGPRALGNRSILADPRRAEMKAIVNRKIKFREPFRPFAPSILDRSVADFVELPDGKQSLATQFMLMVAPVRAAKQSVIPAVTHVDGTGRLQSVTRATNPRYFELIGAFEQETGVPAVLNTSFNLRGEPMVNRPAEAIGTFLRSDIDALVLGDRIIQKR